ncbi:hypothetical protein ABZ871_10555 [Streptomyces populi]
MTDTTHAPGTKLAETNRLHLGAWDRASKVLRLVDQEAGSAHPDLDTRLTALALGSTVEQVAHAQSSMDEPYDEGTVVDHLSRLWAAAIGLRGAPDEGWADRIDASAGTVSG